MTHPPLSVTITLRQLHDFMQLIPYACLTVNAQGQIVLNNRIAEQLFGYTSEEITGQPIDTLLPESFRDLHAHHRATYMAQPEARPLDERLELIGLCRDGRLAPVEIGLSPLVVDGDLFVLAIIRDITRRKEEEKRLCRSQEQLRELSAHLLTLREEERTHISRAIHDDLGQMLTGIKMDIAWLQKRLKQDQEPLLDKTKAMSTLIDTGIQSIRQIATELRPGLLDHFGLEAAVEWHLQEFQERTEIHCKLVSALNDTILDDTIKTAAFRILQEALTNVSRHAQASLVEVSLSLTPTELIMIICDNGRGISESECNNPRAIGLLGMRERARMLAGELKIQGAAGKGTTVSLRLPFPTGHES